MDSMVTDEGMEEFPRLPNYLEIQTDNEDPCMEIMTSYKTFPNIEIFKNQKRRKRFSYSLVMRKKVILAAALLFQFDYEDSSGVCLPYMSTRFGFRSHRLGELLLSCIKASLHKRGIVDIYVPATPQAIIFWKRNGCVPVTVTKCHPGILDACQVFTGTTLLLLKTAPNDEFPPIPALGELERLYYQAKRFSTVATSPMSDAMEAVAEGAKDDIRGWTLMHECVQRKKPGEAYKLTFHAIKNGANVNAVEATFRQTPIFFASNTGDQTLIKLLVQNKACPLHRDANSQLALFYAAKHNSLATIRYFVEKCEVPANAVDTLRRSALTYAMEENRKGSHDDVIQYLKENSKSAQSCPVIVQPPKCLRTTQHSKRITSTTTCFSPAREEEKQVLRRQKNKRNALAAGRKQRETAKKTKTTTTTTDATTGPPSTTTTTTTAPFGIKSSKTPGVGVEKPVGKAIAK